MVLVLVMNGMCVGVNIGLFIFMVILLFDFMCIVIGFEGFFSCMVLLVFSVLVWCSYVVM